MKKEQAYVIQNCAHIQKMHRAHPQQKDSTPYFSRHLYFHQSFLCLTSPLTSRMMKHLDYSPGPESHRRQH